MAATVEGAFVLIDRASSTMEKMERQAMKTMAAIEGVGAAQDAQSRRGKVAASAMRDNTSAMKDTETGAKRAGRSVEDMGRSHESSARRVGVLERALRSLRGEFSRLQGGGSSRGGLTGLKAMERDLKTGRSAMSSFLGAFGALGSALMMFKFPAIGAGIAMLAQSITALGGAALGALPALAALASGMNAIPSAVGVALQGVLTLKAAFSGVVQAATAGMQAQNQWAYNQRAYRQQVTQAQAAVQDAMHGVTDAAFAQQEAVHSLSEAYYAHQQALHGLANALYDQKQAQIELTSARRDAIRTLQDMEFAAQSAVLKEARAGLNIREAQMQLQQAMMTPGTSQLSIEGDRLAVLEAQSSAAQTHTEAVRQRVDYHRALNRDPTSAPVRQVAQAQHALAQAHYGVAEAQHQVQQSTFQITAAQHALADAGYATARAERSVAQAQFSLNTLLRDGNSGVAAYRKSLRDLAPAQRAFVEFLVGPMGPGSRKSLIGQIQGLQQSAASGVFGPLRKGVGELAGAFPMIDRNVRQTGVVLGHLGTRLIDTFFGPKSIAATNGIMQTNTFVLKQGSDALGSLADMTKQVMVAAEPFMRWLSTSVAMWARMHDETMKTAAGQDALRTKFDHLRIVLQELYHMGRNIWMIFHNINKAAWDFNQTLMQGGVNATAHWAAITGSPEAQKRLHDWFMGLLPLLRSLARLVEGVGKGLVSMTSPQTNQGTAHLVDGLTKLLPAVATILLNLERIFGPSIISAMSALGSGLTTLTGSGGPFALWLKMLTLIVKALTWLMQLPVIGKGLVAFFATVFAANTLAKFVLGMTGAILKVRQLAGAWGSVSRNQRRAMGGGMPSPGTTGGGFFSRVFGRGGGAAGTAGDAYQESHMWGIRSMGGPGSVTNPLMVRVEAGGGLGGGFPSGGSSTGKLAGEAATAEKGVAELSRMERFGATLAGAPLIGRFATKLPGALGRGAAAAGGLAGAAGEASGIARMLSPLAGAARFLGPIGAGLAALSAGMAFVQTHGNLGERLQSVASNLSFGLIHPGVTNAQQRAQGTARANASFAQFQTNPTTGLLTAGGTGQFQARIAALNQQINAIQHPAGVATPGFAGGRGPTVAGSVDTKKLLDRQAQVARLNALFDAEQQAAAQAAGQNWQNAFLSGANRRGPGWAMQQVRSGIMLQMAELNPAGRRSLGITMAAWAQQMADQNPKLKGQVDQLNAAIVTSFQGMGQNVQIVNGQILTGTQTEWAQISQAITDPAAVALEKLNGTFGKIAQTAVGSLMAMGYTKGDAQKLVRDLGKGGSAAIGATVGISAKGLGNSTLGVFGITPSTPNVAASGSGMGGTFAVGGRVPGANRRDVYQFGPNILGGGELVVNGHQEQDANARLMRHGEPTLGSIVSSRTTPHWAFAKGGRTSQSSMGNINLSNLPAPNYYGHPGNLQPGIQQVISVMEKFWPGLIVTATRNGSHANQSYHYLGEAVDLASGDYGYMNRAAEWVKTTGMWRSLVEGIHNPNLSVKNGAQVSPGFWGASTWAGHANHIHLAITGMLGQLANAAGGGGSAGTAAASAASGGSGRIPKIRPPRIGFGGLAGGMAQAAANAMAAGMTHQVNAKLAATTGGASGSGLNFNGVTGGGGSASANQTLGRKMMLAAGWPASQWPALQALWTQESGWSSTAVNPSSGAYGIPQSLGHGHPYNLGDARAQIAWGLNYIKGRYGSPNAAEAHERAFNWYAGGGRTANWAGWHRNGGVFRTNGPTVFGAGEGSVPEKVSIEPAVGSNNTRPIEIRIDQIIVNRKGDVKKIVEEELGILADSLRGDHG